MNNLLRRNVYFLAIAMALTAAAQENPSASMGRLSEHLWNKFKTCIDKKTSFFGYNHDKEAALNHDSSEEIACTLGADYFRLEKKDANVYLQSYIHRTGDSQIKSDPTPKVQEIKIGNGGEIADNNSDCAYVIGLSAGWNGNPDLIKRFKNYSCSSKLPFEDFAAFMKK